MIKIVLLSFSVLLFTSFATFAVEETHENIPTLEQAIEQVKSTHNGKIDCNVISDDEFELLGESWMEKIHPGEQHKLMDTMMGGEGSASLKAAHIRMGQTALGCGNYGGMMGMMGGFGSGMMGNWAAGLNNRNSGMMGNTFSDTSWGSFGPGWMMNASFDFSWGWFVFWHFVLGLGFIAVATWVVKAIWQGKGTKK